MSFHNRGKYDIADGSNISLVSAFSVSYSSNNLKVSDGLPVYLWFEQGADEILSLYCVGVLSANGTLATITEVLGSSVDKDGDTSFRLSLFRTPMDSRAYSVTVNGIGHVTNSGIGATVSSILTALRDNINGYGGKTWTATLENGDTELLITTDDANDISIADIVNLQVSDLPPFSTDSVSMITTVAAQIFNNLVGLEGYDVYAGSGQSNMGDLGGGTFYPENALDPSMYAMHQVIQPEGTDYPASLAGKIGPVAARVTLVANADNGVGIRSNITTQDRVPTTFVNGSTGIMGGLICRIAKEGDNHGRRNLIINASLSASGFTYLVTNPLSWLKGGALYENFIAMVSLALSDGVSELKATHWKQGGADVANVNYDTQLPQFFIDYRADIDLTFAKQSRYEIETAPIVLYPVSSDANADPNFYDDLNVIINGIPDIIHHSAVGSIDTIGRSALSGNRVHRDSNELIRMGNTTGYSATINARLNTLDPVAPTKPIIKSVTVNDANATAKIVFTTSYGYPFPELTIQVALDADTSFSSPTYEATLTASLEDTIVSLSPNESYRVRVRGENATVGDWSDVTSKALFDVADTVVPTPISRLEWPGPAGANLVSDAGKVVRWEDSNVSALKWHIFGEAGSNSDVTHTTGSDPTNDNSLVWGGTSGKIPFIRSVAVAWTLGFAFAARIWADSSGVRRAIFGKGELTTNDDAWAILLNGNDLVLWTQPEGAPGGTDSALTFDLSANSMLGKWITIAFVYDIANSEYVLYAGDVDTAFDVVSTISTAGVTLTNVAQPLGIGGVGYNAANDEVFLGKIADVTPWLGPLTKAQLVKHLNTWDNTLPLPLGITGV